MKRLLTLFFLGLLQLLPAAPDSQPTRLDVTVRPEGARISADGVFKGVAPLSVFGLAAGRHLIHVDAPGYCDADAYVDVAPGALVRRAYELEPQTGLLLVRTEPAGADVRYDGMSLGVTPLFIPTLAADRSHVLDLIRPGYRSKRVQVTLHGRKPVVLEETLMLDSATVVCTSEPAGATVTVNGVIRGTTPLEVSGVPKGFARIVFEAQGYGTERRDVKLSAGERLNLSVRLPAKPARVKALSEPSLARVFLDGDWRGSTPLTLDDVKPGRHVLRFEKSGFGPVERTLDLASGEDVTENVQLHSILGTFEIVTIPPGVRVTIDGRVAGTTVSGAKNATKSNILTVGGLSEGTHQIVLHLPGYADQSFRGTVAAGKTVRFNRRLKRVFSPDTEVETVNGVYRGVLHTGSSSAQYLRLEVREGITQDIRRSDIRSVRSIGR